MTAAENKAVFLSYASQDAEAARRICEALRTGGVEVWFDADGGLEHGDEWDAKIRRQIKECVLFIPVISANTQARLEGYFRIEWELAAQRAMGIASGVPFILPVVIDDTREPDALVPDRFRAVQWTRLRAGEVPADVQQRFLKLWSHRTGVLKHEAGAAPAGGRRPEDADKTPPRPKTSRRSPVAAWTAGVAIATVAAILWLRHPAAESPAQLRQDAAATPQKSAAPLTEAQKLVTQAWQAMHSVPEPFRAELEIAGDLCRRAAELDRMDAAVWATWSHVETWYIAHQLDNSAERRESARTKAARAMSLAPLSYEARLAQASYLVRSEGFNSASSFAAEAERQLQELLQEKPDEPRALLALGLLFRNLRRFDEGIATFDSLAAAHPDWSATAYNGKGWLLFVARRFDEAVAAATQSIQCRPFFGNVMLQVRLATAWLGDLDLAKSALERLPLADRQEDGGISAALEVYWYRREGAQMLRVLNPVPREWLESGGVIRSKGFWLGLAHEMSGNPAAAKLAWQKAAQLVDRRLADDPGSASLHHIKGQLAVKLGDRAAAEQAFSLAKQLGSRMDVSAELGDVDGAIRRLQRANWAQLRYNPSLDSLRNDARFQALLADAEKDPLRSPRARHATPAQPASLAAPDLSAAASAKADPKSVAVLAFANLSDDRDNEYFSDGIADELLTVLQKIPGLRVAARTSAFSFKGKGATAKEVGEKLGMAHVVEGSVQKSGKRVKITARLSRAATNEEIWSESFGPLELTDVFATQSEIAQRIVAQLRGQLTGESATTTAAAATQAEIKAQVQAATKGGTKNTEAYQLYLQGRFLATRSGSAEVARGIGYYEQALQLDPDFALAWAALARARLWQLSWEPLNPARAQEARTAAARALGLVPDMADAHSVLSQILLRHAYEWRAAREASARALALAPADAAVITDAAATEQALGSLEKSIELARRAVALDPVSVDTRFYLAMSWLFTDRFAEAEAETRRMIELSPNGIFSHGLLSSIRLMQGRPAEALAAALKEPEKMYRLQNLAAAHYALGQHRESDAALQEMITAFKEVGPYPIAWAYTMRGDRDKAFEWLERSYELRDPGVSWVRGDTLLKPLHADPRWPAFLKKIGLTDEQLK